MDKDDKTASLLYYGDDRFRYDTVSDVVESKVHQCQQNSDA